MILHSFQEVNWGTNDSSRADNLVLEAIHNPALPFTNSFASMDLAETREKNQHILCSYGLNLCQTMMKIVHWLDSNVARNFSNFSSQKSHWACYKSNVMLWDQTAFLLLSFFFKNWNMNYIVLMTTCFTFSLFFFWMSLQKQSTFAYMYYVLNMGLSRTQVLLVFFSSSVDSRGVEDTGQKYNRLSSMYSEYIIKQALTFLNFFCYMKSLIDGRPRLLKIAGVWQITLLKTC